MRKNLRHLRNLRDKLIFCEKIKPAEKKNIRGKKNKKASEIFRNLRLFIERRRRPTLPHCIAVPSAQVSLTSLFGMGRGDPQRYNHQNIVWTTQAELANTSVQATMAAAPAATAHLHSCTAHCTNFEQARPVRRGRLQVSGN